VKRNQRGIGDGTLITLIVVGVILLIGAIWAIRVIFAHDIGRANVHIKTNTADYGIASYDEFHDNCNAIQAQQVVIQNLADTLDADKAAGVDSTQLTVDSHNILAAKNVYAGMVADYNSDASKAATKAQWKAANLPTHISNDYKETLTCE
jgi:hypothetical protein